MPEFPENELSIIFRTHYAQLYPFLEELKKQQDIPKLDKIPLIIAQEDNEDVLVYPNILLDNVGSLFGQRFEALKAQYETEIADPRTVKKWENALSIINKNERLTFSKVLTRYFTPGLEDHKVRDMAERIRARFRPPHMVWCETPEEYVQMYKAPGWSCMNFTNDAPNSGGTEATRVWLEFKNMGKWPSMWYAHSPYHQGAYLQKGVKVLARAGLVRSSLTGTWTCFYIRGENGGHKDVLKGFLTEKGIKESQAQAIITGVFDVPCEELNGKWYCPLPYSDETAKPFSMEYDQTRQVVKFGPKGLLKHQCSNMYDYSGWIDVNLVK